jgi:hypothetical protein
MAEKPACAAVHGQRLQLATTADFTPGARNHGFKPVHGRVNRSLNLNMGVRDVTLRYVRVAAPTMHVEGTQIQSNACAKHTVIASVPFKTAHKTYYLLHRFNVRWTRVQRIQKCSRILGPHACASTQATRPVAKVSARSRNDFTISNRLCAGGLRTFRRRTPRRACAVHDIWRAYGAEGEAARHFGPAEQGSRGESHRGEGTGGGKGEGAKR